jgi:hypothetical protein
MKKHLGQWKIIYALCCLVYMGWIIHVAGNEFDRINSQYRRIVAQLDEGLIRSAALEELTAECRKKAMKPADPKEEECSSRPPPQVVEAKENEIEERLLQAKERGTIKVVLFYTGFTLIFLLGPPIFIYLILAGSIRIYKSVKFVRD